MSVPDRESEKEPTSFNADAGQRPVFNTNGVLPQSPRLPRRSVALARLPWDEKKKRANSNGVEARYDVWFVDRKGRNALRG